MDSAGHPLLKAGIAGCLLPFEDTERTEHHRGSGAYGGDFSSLSLNLQHGVERSVLRKIRGAGHPAGENQPFRGNEVGFLIQGVRLHGDAVGSSHGLIPGNRNRFHIHAGAAHDIDHGERLDFLEAGCQEEVGSIHCLDGEIGLIDVRVEQITAR